jgi:hypothetical protein
MFVQPIRDTHMVPFCYRFVTVLLPFWYHFGALLVRFLLCITPMRWYPTTHSTEDNSSFGVQSEPVALIEVVLCGTTLPLFLSADRIDSLRGRSFLFDQN